jgi:hypothetical protein
MTNLWHCQEPQKVRRQSQQTSDSTGNLPQRGKTVALKKAEPHGKKEPTPTLHLSRVQPGYVCLDLRLYRGRPSGFRLSGRYYHAHGQRQARAALKRPLLKRKLSYKCDPEAQNITS